MPGARILLVEDDDVLRELIERNLQARQHEVSTAVSAQDALTHLRESSYDLILLDINLPDQTGWEMLREAQHEGVVHYQKQDEQGAETLPVVVLSAVRVSPRRLAEFRPLAYLPKPFPMEALLRLAAEAAHHSNEHAEGTSAADTPPFSLYEEDLYA